MRRTATFVLATALDAVGIAGIDAMGPRAASAIEYLYWHEGGGTASTVHRVEVDGTGRTSFPVVAAVDVAAGSDYFVYGQDIMGGDAIVTDLDGANPIGVGFGDGIRGVATSASYLYVRNRGGLVQLQPNPWTSVAFWSQGPSSFAADDQYVYYAPDSAPNVIHRASPDGSNDVPLATLEEGVHDIALGGGWVYWIDATDRHIGRVKTDGSSLTENMIEVNANALAVSATYVFWANYLDTTIGRSNLDGTGVQSDFVMNAGTDIRHMAAGGTATTTTTLPVTAIDHFLLYEVKTSEGTPKFVSFAPVTLADQFRSAGYQVEKPKYLGLPANKNAGGVMDDVTHLKGYQVKPVPGTPDFATLRDVEIANQCHALALEVSKPANILVPTRKSLVASPPAPDIADHQLDHYLCYKAKPQTKLADGTPLAKFPKGIQVDVADQFQTRRYDLKKITRLCTPVNKSGSPVIVSGPNTGQSFPITPAPIRHPADHLVCYQARRAKKLIPQTGCGPANPAAPGTKIVPAQAKHVPLDPVFVNNQFGPEVLRTIKEAELCIPSIPGCRIGGTFFPAGATNGQCQVCRTSASTTSWTNRPDGTSCNDGSLCTQTDTCQAGICTGGNPVVCTAPDDCHDPTCDPATGECSNPEKLYGTRCFVDAPCVVQDIDPSVGHLRGLGYCAFGECRLIPRDCNPADRCVFGLCNPETDQCETSPVECVDPSDFADPPGCFVDTCSAGTGICIMGCVVPGACLAGPGPCGSSAVGCTSNAQCDDHNLCTNDVCAAGICTNSAITCNDGDICTIDYCNDPEIGCQKRPQDANFCDDGIACTEDPCVPFQGCTKHIPRDALCPDDGDPCTAGVCNLANADTGCEYRPICNDGDACTVDMCEPTTGTCSHEVKHCTRP